MQPGRPQIQMPTAGPATKGLVIALVVVSVLFSMTQRYLDFGVVQLSYDVPSILGFQVWRLITYCMIAPEPLSLIISALVLWFFGSWFESQWGTRDFLQFFFASSIGAGIIAIPLYFLINFAFPFDDVGQAFGPGAAFDAMLVAMALIAPNSNVMLGFVLPVKARTLVLAFLGFHVVSGLMTGAATLSITLGGMAMGYILITGIWRPGRFITKFQLFMMRFKRRRTGLYVVPPKEERDRTLH